MWRSLAQAKACATLLLVLCACGPEKQEEKIWLWAWERNEDLTWLDTSRFSVAYLAGSYKLDSISFEYRPRLQPLNIPQGTETMPVFRIESTDSISESATEMLASHLANRVRDQKGWLQLDFDAKLSERKEYAALIRDLRSRLPEATISITALASWVMSDPWMDTLPIDEAVPMFFDMGVDHENINLLLSRGGEVKSKKAQGVYGLALDEEIPVDVRGSRLYLFSKRRWDKNGLDNFLKHYALLE